MLKPGYKQTDLGIIPEEWEVEVLGDLTTKVGSGITPTGGSKVYKDHGRPFIRSQNVGWGTLLLDDVSHIDEATHSTFIGTEIKNRDVLLNITGASIGRAATADKRIVHGNVNQHVCIIRTDKKLLNPSFLAAYLLSDKGQNIIDSFQTGGNRQGLNFQQIKSFQIPLPPPAEQQAIADTLGAVDALLREQRALLAKKRDLKQATQTALLTRERRLPGFSGEWQEKRLDEVAQIDPENLGSSTNSAYRFKYVALEGVNKGQLVSWNYYTYANAPSRARRIVRKNDILVGTVRPNLLNHYYQSEDVKDLICSTGFAVVRCNEEKADARFIFQHFFFDVINQQIDAVIGGSNYPAISNRDVRALTVLLPQPDEQRAIADILSDMDAEAAGLAAQVAKTEALKQGLVQDLLTGTIRLTGATKFSTV